MSAETVIASASNALLKRVRAVLAGKDDGRVVLEGDRLIADAVRAGWELEAVLVADDREDLAQRWEGEGLPVRRVLADLLARASSLETSPGTLALAGRPTPVALDEVELGPDALVLVAAGVSDPGNLGALARSAEAAGADLFVTTAGSARPWGTKGLRGSMGSLLRVRVSEVEEPEAVASALAARGLRAVKADTRGGTPWDEADWSGPVALWMASESGELPACTRDFDAVSIPMRGEVESLNVAVAGALLLFAAGRARGGGA